MRDGARAHRCDTCGSWTYRKRCPVCPGRPALLLLDRLTEREEAGETIDWVREYDEVMGFGTPRPG